MLAITAFVFIGAFGFAVIPGFAAQPALPMQGTQVAPPPSGTQAVPVTGTTTNGGTVSWIVWVIIGIAIVALLVALLARGGGTTNINQ